jgi:hypothetical protein
MKNNQPPLSRGRRFFRIEHCHVAAILTLRLTNLGLRLFSNVRMVNLARCLWSLPPSTAFKHKRPKEVLTNDLFIFNAT